MTPRTWLPFSDEERDAFSAPKAAATPTSPAAATGSTSAMAPKSCCSIWRPAPCSTSPKQLLGDGEVVWPGGLDETNTTIGPALLTEDNISTMKVHLGPEAGNWLGQATRKTEQLRLPKTGPVWATGQGSRGLYCTLPNSPGGRVNKYRNAKVQPSAKYPSAHAAEGMYESRRRLSIAAYFDDLPPRRRRPASLARQPPADLGPVVRHAPRRHPVQ